MSARKQQTAAVATEYMRADEGAPYLRVSKRTFARMKSRGQIPFIRLSPGVVVYRRSDLDRLMDKLTVQAVV